MESRNQQERCGERAVPMTSVVATGLAHAYKPRRSNSRAYSLAALVDDVIGVGGSWVGRFGCMHRVSFGPNRRRPTSTTTTMSKAPTLATPVRGTNVQGMLEQTLHACTRRRVGAVRIRSNRECVRVCVCAQQVSVVRAPSCCFGYA